MYMQPICIILFIKQETHYNQENNDYSFKTLGSWSQTIQSCQVTEGMLLYNKQMSVTIQIRLSSWPLPMLRNAPFGWGLVKSSIT